MELNTKVSDNRTAQIGGQPLNKDLFFKVASKHIRQFHNGYICQYGMSNKRFISKKSGLKILPRHCDFMRISTSKQEAVEYAYNIHCEMVLFANNS